MRGQLLAFTGPFKCGKDALAAHLVQCLIRAGRKAKFISGSGIFRAIALYAIQLGYDPSAPLPLDAFSDCTIHFDGETVSISKGANTIVYTADDYQTQFAGKAGSDLATNSPDVYRPFAHQAIGSYIQQLSDLEICSILGMRNSFTIAQEIPMVPSLVVYLSVTAETQEARLRNHLLHAQSQVSFEKLIGDELARDAQDRHIGTLPHEHDSILLDTHLPVQSGVLYRLDNNGTREEAAQTILRAFERLG